MKKDDLSLKKQPLQDRSRFMVKAIKEAATHILADQGLENFTTNAVAERAGVSIGSLYQYFGSKDVLLAEIKRDHFQELRDLFNRASRNLKTGQLEELVDAFIDASVQGHLLNPELHRALSDDRIHLPITENDDSDTSIGLKVEQALEEYRQQLRPGLDIQIATRLIYSVVEKTIHDAVLNEPNRLHQEQLVSELKLMILTYLKG